MLWYIQYVSICVTQLVLADAKRQLLAVRRVQVDSFMGARDDAATVQNFVTHCGYDASANHILPVPSGVVWAAWEKFIAIEPWEGFGSDPRTADTSVVRLATYNGWFAVPQGDGQAQEKGYPKGMPNYIKHTGGIPFAQVKQ